SLPTDFEENVRIFAEMNKSDVTNMSLSEETTEQLLHQAPQAYRTQINDILLTALVRTIHKWTGKEGVYLALEGHGREEIIPGVDLSRTIGWFTSIFPLYLRLDNTQELGSLLKSIKEQLRCIPQHGVGHGILRYLTKREELQALYQLPKPEVSFNYLGQFDSSIKLSNLFDLASESSGDSEASENQTYYRLNINSQVTKGQLQ